MTIPDDNVVPMPTALDRLASRASEAMTIYKRGRGETILAVLSYGEALLEGRTLHASDKLFGQWVADNGLDTGKPWNERIERNAAMLLARLTRENGHTGKDLADCQYPAPTTSGSGTAPKSSAFSPRREAAKAFTKAADAMCQPRRGARQRPGRRLPWLGVSETTALKALTSPIDAREKDILGNAPFTEKGKLTIDKAIALHKERLSKAFEQRVGDEVRRRIATADDHARAQLKEANRQLREFEMERGRKGVFTKTEFRQMIMLCHPDNSASQETRAHLLDLLVGTRSRLIKEA